MPRRKQTHGSRKMKRSQVQTNAHRFFELWNSRSFVLVLVIVLSLTLTAVTKEIVRRVEMRGEIARLESELTRLHQRNSEMQDFIALLNTSAYQEKEARIKLGLQKPGERMVLFPDQKANGEIVLPNADTVEYTTSENDTSNPEKWFNFFWDKFHNTQST